MSETILVTGATGLIGFNLVRQLLKDGYNVIGLVRNIDKARKMFQNCDRLSFVLGDVTDTVDVKTSIDYIIHAASQTSSKSFVSEPLETIQTAINGTTNILELAKKKEVKSFVYLSSMEVYGSPSTDEKITEKHGTNIDTMSVRSSYPEGKRMCESICKAYQSEFGIPVKVIRLTQTFGAGVGYNDSRVFAEFARCVIEKRNIVLHTKGDTRRSYLSTDDAVSAILTVLQKGEDGEAYNAANEDTYCSIYEMANIVAHYFTNDEIKVLIEEDNNDRGYAPVLNMNLDTRKLRALGWNPKDDLHQMFYDMILNMRK